MAVLLTLSLALGAGPRLTVQVDDWTSRQAGSLDFSTVWRTYPSAGMSFKHPPAILADAGRPSLHLATEGEAMRVGRPLKIRLAQTPWLAWEWKPLVLPEGADVRDTARNDQVGRVMIIFEGMKAILYVWDTTAPVGTEVHSDALDFFQRVLVVVRSGREGTGRWHREERNVYADYRRLFDAEPGATRLVGFESHSNDTKTRTSVLFGSARFEAR